MRQASHVAPAQTRTVLLDGALVRAELLSFEKLPRVPTPSMHSPEHQVLLPLRGVCNWHLGTGKTLVDVNQTLFIAAGDVSSDSHPTGGDFGCLLLTPHRSLLEELWRCDGTRLAARPAFARRVVPSGPRLQRAAAHFAGAARTWRPAEIDLLEEAAIALLAVAADAPAVGGTAAGPCDSRLVAAVKERLSGCDDRLTLTELARQLGVSPAYLTDVFRRSTGMPIARYHRRLRLAHALAELPHADDITALALRVGFSSHAHFSSAFKETFGQTPSAYRATARTGALHGLRRRPD